MFSPPRLRQRNHAGTGQLAGDAAYAETLGVLAEVGGVVLLLGCDGLLLQRLPSLAHSLDEALHDFVVGLRVDVEQNLPSCNALTDQSLNHSFNQNKATMTNV